MEVAANSQILRRSWVHLQQMETGTLYLINDIEHEKSVAETSEKYYRGWCNSLRVKRMHGRVLSAIFLELKYKNTSCCCCWKFLSMNIYTVWGNLRVQIQGLVIFLVYMWNIAKSLSDGTTRSSSAANTCVQRAVFYMKTAFLSMQTPDILLGREGQHRVQ